VPVPEDSQNDSSGLSPIMSQSVLELQKASVLRMLNLNADQSAYAGQTWKVLIYDKFCQEVVAPLLKVGGLRNHGVTLHLNVNSERLPVADVPAVYFVEPTEANVARIVEDLKDASEPYRKMVMETIDKVIANLGVADIDSRLEEQIIDGIVYAFQEQTSDDTTVMLNGFGTVVNSLGARVKPYLPQIAGIIRWRLNTPSARVRQQAADLIARIAVVMKQCGEEQRCAR